MPSFHIAPVQGHTDAAYRHFHAQQYPGNNVYYTPFIRLEKEGIRNKDIKDLTSELNSNHHLIPQIIFRDKKELTALVKILKDLGFKEINLNMGCPFPLQTGHRRGAATIANEELAKDVVECIKDNPDISFSVKMRLGLQEPDEWKKLLPYLNQVELQNIVLHPRVAKQQYGGEVDLAQFEEFLQQSKNPVIYNGDIKSPERISELLNKYPKISGIMMGRGLLARPSLIKEYEDGEETDQQRRIENMLEFHRLLFNHYNNILCGDTQIIAKIQPFWEYAEEEIGRKAWKAIKKAVNVPKYQTAVALINQ